MKLGSLFFVLGILLDISAIPVAVVHEQMRLVVFLVSGGLFLEVVGSALWLMSETSESRVIE